MKRISLLCLLSISLCTLAVAQIHYCGQEHMLKGKTQTYQQAVTQTYEQALRSSEQLSNSRSEQVVTLPVVFHVVYNTPEQNISDEFIQSQLDVLNQDFQRLNPDAGDAREMYQAIAGNPNMRFALANTDPEGNPTTGITRTETTVNSFFDVNLTIQDLLAAVDSCDINLEDERELWDSLTCFSNEILEIAYTKLEAQENPVLIDDVKFTEKGGINLWDPERYINIWICNLNFRIDGMPTPAVLGFATPPIEAPNFPIEFFPENYELLDGIVLHYAAVGVDNPNATEEIAGSRGGRTATHEMGHYFGLRHIFGDGNCEEDDGLMDTPTTNALINPVEFGTIVTCTTSKEIDTCPEDDRPDMIENYMDYSLQTCQNLFTQDQVGLMRAMLEGPRSGLLEGQLTSTFSDDLSRALTLYPNPTNGLLTVSLEAYDLADFNLTIDNLMGQQFLTQRATSTVNLNHLAAGIYTLRLHNEKIAAVRKIVISKN